jgi:anaerobic magnesium-protoporphyrin IX monomethyl ester cyclase
MSQVLLTHSYCTDLDPKQKQLQQPYPPLGTLYAASFLRSKGFDVSFYDTMLEHTLSEFESMLINHKPKYLVIYDDGFNYLTKMCLSNMRQIAFDIIKTGKKHDCIVIVSGSDATDNIKEFLNTGADFIITGEAEITLLELLNEIENGSNNFTSVNGLAYKENNSIIKTARRELLKDLDALPMPAFDLVDIEKYKKTWLKSSGYFSLNLVTTRGCPFKCNWCAKPIYGNRYNSHSPEYVTEMIKFLKNNFNVDHIWFCDDIFGLKPGWVKRFSELIENEKLKIKYKIQSRADMLLDEDLVIGLSSSGCETVWIGAESGSQKILDKMEKGIKIEQIYKATALLKKHRIKPSFFLQFGYPGETIDDIKLTMKMINELLPEDIGISVSYPLPGTKFYEEVKNNLNGKTNWKDSDDIDTFFRSDSERKFYRSLHKYIHKNYRMHQSIAQLKKIMRNPIDKNFSDYKKAASFLYYVPASFIRGKKLRSLYKNISIKL